MRVIIDPRFFNLEESGSRGLISGLKKMAMRNIQLSVPGPALKDESLLKMLYLEGISLSNGISADDISADAIDVAASGTSKEGAVKNTSYFITLKSDNKLPDDYEIPGNSGLNSIMLPEIKTIAVKDDGEVKSFEEAALLLISRLRQSVKVRKTKETEILAEVALDGQGSSSIDTGVGFFDHMLDQIARHSNIDLTLRVKGDLSVDEHHTVEDTGITLGEALLEALGDKKGIRRYGFFLPMDETTAKCALDLGGRTFLNFKCKFKREKVGNFPTELTEEFFRGLASGLKANIYLRAKGKNDHHKIEALFKAFAKALNEALRLDERNENRLPSTKGLL